MTHEMMLPSRVWLFHVRIPQDLPEPAASTQTGSADLKEREFKYWIAARKAPHKIRRECRAERFTCHRRGQIHTKERLAGDKALEIT